MGRDAWAVGAAMTRAARCGACGCSILVLVAVLVPACRDKIKRGTIAEKHRAVAAACDSASAPGVGTPGAGGACDRDSDCKGGRNGRCMPKLGMSATGNECEYDACFSDAECKSGETCTCGIREPWPARHRCQPSNCRVDRDCGPKGFCSPSKHALASKTVEGWYCHTDDDECMNDSDCPSEVPGRTDYCGYNANKERWVCDRARASN